MSGDAAEADVLVQAHIADAAVLVVATADPIGLRQMVAHARALNPGIAVVLRKFEVHAVSEGEDAQGEARVYVEYNRRSYRGASVSTNIVESGTRAFLEVINRIEQSQRNATRAPARSASRAPPAPQVRRGLPGQPASTVPPAPLARAVRQVRSARLERTA